MTQAKQNSKYDPFFANSMERPAIAEAFHKHYLVRRIRQETHLDTLTRLDRVSTNTELEQRRGDIAYTAKMKAKEAALFTCSEHQSDADIMILPRFLGYILGVLIPLGILSVFLQCGWIGIGGLFPIVNEKVYNQRHLFVFSEVRGILEFALRFHLIDCTQISDKQFLKTGHCAPMRA